jgi:hypothetical protein
MKVLINKVTRAIHAVDDLGAWQVPDFCEVVDVAGDAQTFAWPSGDAMLCQVVNGAVVLGADGIAAFRVRRWKEIKAARDAARDAGFLFNGNLVQSDAVSRDNVSGAALAATIAKAAGIPYSVEWTMADNSVITFDADQVIAMFVAGAEFVKTIYARGVTLREQISTANTEERIQAIAW